MTRPIDIRFRGPLAPYHRGFCAELETQGYAPLSASNLVRVFAHLSRWLQNHRLEPHELTLDRVSKFLRSRQRYTHWRSERGLAPILDYLRRLGVMPPPSHVADTPLDQFLDHLGDYLQRERGLALATIRRRQRIARRFLAPFVDSQGIHFENLTSGDVTRFVLRECRQWSVGFAKVVVTDLRSLLRFLHLEGHTSTCLAAAAPAIAGWRGQALPQGLDPTHVRRLLKSCDRRTAIGRRDYAILMLLVRLGLRAGEATALQLDDVDWRHGEILIRGKGRRDERLPLPPDVGRALMAYLRRGRPRSTSRAIFLRSRAPYGALQTVAGRVGQVCIRGGMARLGAHRLRHTAATEMLQKGCSLPEVAQVLRHRSLSTTAIYAKVDRKALRALAQPWPGGRP